MKTSSTLPTLYITGFLVTASQSLLIPIMPLYASKLGASVSEIGLIVGTLAYSTALCNIPFGLLSDKFGRRIVLLIGSAISALISFLYAFSTNPPQLYMLRAVNGIGSAAIVAGLFAAVIDLGPADQRGKSIGWYTTSTQSGLMTGPVIGGYLLNSLGFTSVFVSSGILALVVLIIIFTSFAKIPRRDAAGFLADKSWSWMKQKAFFGVLLSLLAITFGIGTLSAYIPIYAEGAGITATGAGLIITLAYASSAGLRIIAGTLSDRLGRKPLIIGGMLISTIMIALISQFHSLALLSIVSFGFGIGMGIVLPSSLALTADLSPPQAIGLSTGTVSFAHQIGTALGPTAMGAVAEISNLETMFLACGLTLALGLVITYILLKTG